LRFQGFGLLKSISLNSFALDEVLDSLLDLERLRRVLLEEAIVAT